VNVGGVVVLGVHLQVRRAREDGGKKNDDEAETNRARASVFLWLESRHCDWSVLRLFVLQIRSRMNWMRHLGHR
jgi:hypothetical protein